jgi:hypothetical protein
LAAARLRVKYFQRGVNECAAALKKTPVESEDFYYMHPDIPGFAHSRGHALIIRLVTSMEAQ